MHCYWARSDADADGVDGLFAVQNIPTAVDLPEQPLLAVLLIQLWMSIRRWALHLPGPVELKPWAVPFGHGDDVPAPMSSLWLCLYSRLMLFPGLLLVCVLAPQLVALLRIQPALQLSLDLLQELRSSVPLQLTVDPL
jgi:hypothetical protein